jgi:hypothetical protein
VFIVEHYLKHQAYRDWQTMYRLLISYCCIPSRLTVWHLSDHFCEIGSVSDKNQCGVNLCCKVGWFTFEVSCYLLLFTVFLKLKLLNKKSLYFS